MLCPKCKKDNPDNASVCSSCGQVLQAVPFKRASKLAVTAFVLSLCAIIMPPIFALPALILAIGSVFHIRKRADKLRGQKLALAAIACSVLGLVILRIWRIDAPPISDDYTMADFRQVPASCNPSYELLMKLADEPNAQKNSTIRLSQQDTKVFWKIVEPLAYKDGHFVETSKIVQEHKTEITDLWNKVKSARAIIDKLNTFEEIADLSEPYPNDERRRFCFNFVDMGRLCIALAYVQVNEGNDIDAVRELVKFDSVVRKLAPNARSVLTFMACFICLKNDIGAANYIINNPQTSSEALDILAEHYSQLKSEQISVHNAILGEYLLLRKPHIIEFQERKGGDVLKPNSLLRLNRNICDYWIGIAEPSASRKPQLKVWPSFYPDMPSINYRTDELSFWYKLYNPIGSIIVGIMKYKNRLIESKTEIEALGGLIQIALNKRLGKEVDFKAHVYGDKYIIDKDRRIIFSPSRNEIGYDIALPYDPNVIKF